MKVAVVDGTHWLGVLPILLACFVSAAGCGRQLRVPSPDGAWTATCNEESMAGDTNYVVQLERPGAQPRRLYEIGDGDPCDEIAWSTDGATLAVLTSHVARLLFVDVDWALAHPTVQTGSWSWRVVDLGPGLTASHVTFVGSFEVNVLLRRGETTFTKRVLIPRPIVTGHGRTQ